MATNSTAQNLTTLKVTDFATIETSFTAIALLVIMLLTIIGNLMVCYVVLSNKRLWTEMNMFLVNLAFGDLAVGLICMVFPLITAIKREWIFGRGILCQLNACCNSVLFCSTIFTHTVISIDRYIVIVHPMKKIMTRKKAALMIVGVWVFSVFIVLGPVFGWGRMEYNASTLQCGFGFPRDKMASMYIVIVAIIAFIIPLLIMTYTYIRIYISVLEHTRRMSETATAMQQQAVFSAQKRIVFTFFIALLAFFACWAPFFSFIAFAVVVKNPHDIPHGLGLASYVCGFINSACNPFIIGLRSKQFKSGFSRILCCCRGRDPKSSDSARRLKADKTISSRTMTDYDPDKDSVFESDPQKKRPLLPRRTEERVGTDARARNGSSLGTESVTHSDKPLLRDPLDEMDELTLPKKHKVHMVRPRKRSSESSECASQRSAKAVSYKQFLHVKGDSSWRESGV